MSILSAVISAGATIVGAKIAASGNKKAAAAATAGEERSAEAIREANRLAQARLTQAGKIPTQLTASQEAELDRARDDIRGQLASSGLRGSGRATVAAFREVESDLRNRMLEGERGRRERLATGLASIDMNSGQVTGDAAQRSGQYAANLATANAGLRGAAVGSILGSIASEAKERESRRAS